MTVSFYRSIKLQKSAEVVVLWVNGGKKRAKPVRRAGRNCKEGEDVIAGTICPRPTQHAATGGRKCDSAGMMSEVFPVLFFFQCSLDRRCD